MLPIILCFYKSYNQQKGKYYVESIEKAMLIVASRESDSNVPSYSAVDGNYDGAGLSIGFFQFTFISGSLSSSLRGLALVLDIAVQKWSTLYNSIESKITPGMSEKDKMRIIINECVKDSSGRLY